MRSIVRMAVAGATALTLSVSAAGAVAAAGHAAPGTAQGPVGPGARSGSVVLGATGSAANAPISCVGGSTTVQYEDTGAPGYQVPAAGVLTGFSYYATGAGQVRAVLMGPSATAEHKTLVGASPLETVTAGSLQTFPVRVLAPAGAVLGVYNSQDSMGCWGVAPTADVTVIGAFDPGTETDFSGTSTSNQIADISAVWEPDADHDGYGDVSQDGCPQSAQTHATCEAPDTTVTKQPKKVSTKRKVKIAFSSLPGATFTCRLDKRAVRPCTSPFRAKVKPGKHAVVITATSPIGVVEAVPARVRFRVVRPR